MAGTPRHYSNTNTNIWKYCPEKDRTAWPLASDLLCFGTSFEYPQYSSKSEKSIAAHFISIEGGLSLSHA